MAAADVTSCNMLTIAGLEQNRRDGESGFDSLHPLQGQTLIKPAWNKGFAHFSLPHLQSIPMLGNRVETGVSWQPLATAILQSRQLWATGFQPQWRNEVADEDRLRWDVIMGWASGA